MMLKVRQTNHCTRSITEHGATPERVVQMELDPLPSWSRWSMSSNQTNCAVGMTGSNSGEGSSSTQLELGPKFFNDFSRACMRVRARNVRAESATGTIFIRLPEV